MLLSCCSFESYSFFQQLNYQFCALVLLFLHTTEDPEFSAISEYSNLVMKGGQHCMIHSHFLICFSFVAEAVQVGEMWR
jgi:hypothetical protein